LPGTASLRFFLLDVLPGEFEQILASETHPACFLLGSSTIPVIMENAVDKPEGTDTVGALTVNEKGAILLIAHDLHELLYLGRQRMSSVNRDGEVFETQIPGLFLFLGLLGRVFFRSSQVDYSDHALLLQTLQILKRRLAGGAKFLVDAQEVPGRYLTLVCGCVSGEKKKRKQPATVCTHLNQYSMEAKGFRLGRRRPSPLVLRVFTPVLTWYYWAANTWGMIDMKKLVLVALVLSFCMLLPAQDRATMSPPVIRAMPEGNVSFSAQFSDLSPNGEYRVGFGTATGKLGGMKLEILKDGTALSVPVASFDQGYASNWWNISKVALQGFQLSGNSLPPKSGKLTLRVTVPKVELDKVKKVYMLVSRKYGEDVWYIEDGTEMDESYW
jgi:hypothetical protein